MIEEVRTNEDLNPIRNSIDKSIEFYTKYNFLRVFFRLLVLPEVLKSQQHFYLLQRLDISNPNGFSLFAMTLRYLDQVYASFYGIKYINEVQNSLCIDPKKVYPSSRLISHSQILVVQIQTVEVSGQQFMIIKKPDKTLIDSFEAEFNRLLNPEDGIPVNGQSIADQLRSIPFTTLWGAELFEKLLKKACQKGYQFNKTQFFK